MVLMQQNKTQPAAGAAQQNGQQQNAPAPFVPEVGKDAIIIFGPLAGIRGTIVDVSTFGEGETATTYARIQVSETSTVTVNVNDLGDQRRFYGVVNGGAVQARVVRTTQNLVGLSLDPLGPDGKPVKGFNGPFKAMAPFQARRLAQLLLQSAEDVDYKNVKDWQAQQPPKDSEAAPAEEKASS